MGPAVYLICAIASLVCAAMLVRQYLRTRVALLFWSAACFLFFMAANILLFTDLVLIPGVDLMPLRTGLTLLGSLSLLYGLITKVD